MIEIAPENVQSFFTHFTNFKQTKALEWISSFFIFNFFIIFTSFDKDLIDI